MVLSRYTDQIFDEALELGPAVPFWFTEEILPLVEEHLWIQSHSLESNWLETKMERVGGGNPRVRREKWKAESVGGEVRELTKRS